MCLAAVYKRDDSGNQLLYENIANVEFSGEGTVLTDVLGRKFKVEGQISTMNLTDGIIVVKD